MTSCRWATSSTGCPPISGASFSENPHASPERIVLVFDYGRDGGWFVRLIEWIEGPNYPLFIAEDREQAFRRADLQLERVEQVSELGSYWLCTPRI